MGSLEEIHMPQNGINHPGVTALANAVQHNPQLRVLNLNDNTFTKKGAIAMAQVCAPTSRHLTQRRTEQNQTVMLWLWINVEITAE